jgi:hypothetical protein
MGFALAEPKMIDIANGSGNAKGSECRISYDVNAKMKLSVNTKPADVATPINCATN